MIATDKEATSQQNSEAQPVDTQDRPEEQEISPKERKVPRHKLSYDKIIKSTLSQSNKLTIAFINGLFNDNIPSDATIEWLDKETIDDAYKAIVADFYPRINGQMYSIEVEADDHGDMAVRVFKYTLGGALRHNMTATDSELIIKLPQPCVIFLDSKASTPKKLVWKFEFFDGDTKTLEIPTIRMAELSVEEIAQRDLMPIGQFYLRTFEPLTDSKADDFQSAARELLAILKKEAIEHNIIPHHLVFEMQEIIRKTAENALDRANMEVDFDMTTNILETLPWIDYSEVFENLEERARMKGEAKGRAEGKAEGRAEGEAKGRAEGEAEGKAEGKAEGRAEGKAERDLEIALRAFEKRAQSASFSEISQMLGELGISESTIETARKQYEEGLSQ